MNRTEKNKSALCKGCRLPKLVIPAIWTALMIAVPLAPGQSYKVLHSFAGGPGDGAESTAALVAGAGGKLYGTTRYGGTNLGGPCGMGCGTIFTVNKKSGVETVWHNFDGSRGNGGIPSFGLVKDSAGNFYGVAATSEDPGEVYKLDAAGNYSVIYQFSGDPALDGAGPTGVLARDNAGNLYGTTVIGGGLGHQGTIFKVDPAGTETILYSFTGADGSDPETGVIRDGGGNLYGSTYAGGTFNCGVIFKLTPKGKYNVLHHFTCGTDGAHPQGLVRDSSKNLYGVTDSTVLKIDAAGTLTTLYTFSGAADGAFPRGKLVRDTAGNLYGTTIFGGIPGPCGTTCGVVFKVDPSGKETVLHAFTAGSTDGAMPQGGVILDGQGNIYGTTLLGGTSNNGVVFKITP